MSQQPLTSRQARGTSVRPPRPNVPAPATSANGRVEGPRRPAVAETRWLPELPPGAEQVGWVRLPLTLTTAPRAYLYAIPGRPPIWYVRLPAQDGSPQWRLLSRTEPVRWAIASGLPRVARRALALLRRAERPPARSEFPRSFRGVA